MKRLLLVLLALLFLGGSAHGAFPGRNGSIVFASDRSPLALGEILSIRPDGSGRRQLTNDWTRQSNAVHAPKGRLVAYAGGDGLYVMRDDGTARRRIAKTSRGVSFWWSRDGRWLAFAESKDSRDSDLSVVRMDGKAQRRIGACRAVPCAGWLPDGRSLVVGSPEGLAIFDIRTGVSRPLTTKGGDFGPVASPRGDVLAFGSKQGLELVGIDGGNRRLLARPICAAIAWAPDGARVACLEESSEVLTVITLSGRRALIAESPKSPPAWSPNGSRIAFAYNRGYASEQNAIWTVAPDGRNARQVTRERRGDLGAPSWSPDGKRIFASVSATGGNDLWTIRPNGSGLERLTDDVDRDSNPRWSPDGTRLAWQCGHNDEICVMRADGTGRRVVARGSGGGPAWSPDGAMLAYSQGSGIWLVRSDGSSKRALTSNRGDYEPAWSPDGRLIAFANERRVEYGPGDADDMVTERLYVIGLDGTRRRLLHTSGPDAYYHRPDWAPDGKRLVVVDQETPGPCESDVCPTPSNLFSIRLDGKSNPLLRIPGSSELEPAWAPDGKHVVFLQNGDVTVAPIDGGPASKVTRGNWENEAPDWQPLCTRYGTDRGDRLRGTRGPDVICGLGGDDRIAGGPGRDRLFGAEGADELDARDGTFDVVGCGPGRDTVLADRIDLVGVDCERVTRR